jgi:hypothetical protein
VLLAVLALAERLLSLWHVHLHGGKKTKKRQKFAIEKQPNPSRNRFVDNYEPEEKEEAQNYELNYKTSM